MNVEKQIKFMYLIFVEMKLTELHNFITLCDQFNFYKLCTDLSQRKNILRL